MARLIERVDRLEEALIELAKAQKKTEEELVELKNEMLEFKNEMRDFKNEMRDFKNEMLEFKNGIRDFKNEMLEFKNEMRDFKNEMLEFKNEMRDFKNEMRDFKNEMLEFKNWSKKMIEWNKRMINRMNKQWGNLANKLGKLVEDIFGPSADIIIQKYFGCKPNDVSLRRKIVRDGGILEIDIMAVCEKERKFFVFEVKGDPDRQSNIDDFVRKMRRIEEILREYAGYEKHWIYAGLNMKKGTIDKLSKRGIYALIFKGDVFEIPNVNEVKKNTQ